MSDLLNKAKGALGGSGSSSQPAGGQKEDYGDKALDMGEKKMGMSQNRETNEKITDAGRGMYEKSTGKQVSDKVCDTRYEFLVLKNQSTDVNDSSAIRYECRGHGHGNIRKLGQSRYGPGSTMKPRPLCNR